MSIRTLTRFPTQNQRPACLTSTGESLLMEGTAAPAWWGGLQALASELGWLKAHLHCAPHMHMDMNGAVCQRSAFITPAFSEHFLKAGMPTKCSSTTGHSGGAAMSTVAHNLSHTGNTQRETAQQNSTGWLIVGNDETARNCWNILRKRCASWWGIFNIYVYICDVSPPGHTDRQELQISWRECGREWNTNGIAVEEVKVCARQVPFSGCIV